MNPFVKTVKEQYIVRFVNLLHWVYSTDPDELTIDREIEWTRGEKIPAESLEEQKQILGYIYQEYGRRRVVSLITSYFTSTISEKDYLFVFLLTELCEVNLCVEDNQIIPAIIRGSSFLHQALRTKLDSTDDFAGVIEDASGNVVTDPQLRVIQFIRLVRNDAAHNFSYDTEYGYRVHRHAATCVVTLLLSLMDSWFGFDWFDAELFVESQLSIEQCIYVVEEHFGFDWDSEEEWYVKYSLYEDFDNRTN